MGWLSDFVSNPIDTALGTVNKVVDNPIPAITAAVTQNPAALLAYGAPQPSGMSQQQAQNYYSGGVNLLGGALQNRTNQAAAQQTADSLRQAGQQAQGMAQFRPVGVTNTFGTSSFTVDPTTGQLTNAGYTLSPQLQAAQNTLMGNQAQNLTDLSTIQNLGRGYLAQTPQQAAQQYIQNQQALLTPLREQQWANLANQDYNRGTTGLKVAQGGNLQSANPYAAALANAQSQQDLQLAAQAQQAGQQQTAFGQGLLSSAYQPYTTGLQATAATEQLGQNPFGLSTNLAQQQATAGANAGRLGLGANIAAAETLFPALQQNPIASALQSPSFSQGVGQWLGGVGNLFGQGNSITPDMASYYNTQAQGLGNTGDLGLVW